MADNLDRALDLALVVCGFVQRQYAYNTASEVIAIAVTVAAGRLARKAGVTLSTVLEAATTAYQETEIDG